MTTKAEIIQRATNYILEYADCREEHSAEKTAEIIFDLALKGLNCPFCRRKIFYAPTLELEPDHDRTLPATIIADVGAQMIADNTRDYWSHLSNRAER